MRVYMHLPVWCWSSAAAGDTCRQRCSRAGLCDSTENTLAPHRHMHISRTVPVLCWSSCIWRLPAGCGAAVQAPPSAMPPSPLPYHHNYTNNSLLTHAHTCAPCRCYAGPALRLVLLVSAPVQAPPTVPKTPLPSPPSRIYPHTLPVLCWSSTASGDAYSLGGSSAGPFNCDNTLPTPSPPLAWFTVCHGSTGIYPPTHLASVVLVQCCVW
jgi:hypothetical protein